MGSSIAREMRFCGRAKVVRWISWAFHWLSLLHSLAKIIAARNIATVTKIITAIKIVAVMARLNVRFTAHLGWLLLIH